MPGKVNSPSCSCRSCEERFNSDTCFGCGEQFFRLELEAEELIRQDELVPASKKLLEVSSRKSLPVMQVISQTDTKHGKQALNYDRNNHRIMTNLCMVLMKLETWELALLCADTIIERHGECV